MQNDQAAVDNAKRYTSCDPGYCLKYTRTWLEIPSKEADAITAWRNAKRKHAESNDKADAQNPPKGAPVFWDIGEHGHIALAVNNNNGRSTDTTSSGQVGTKGGDWWRQNWGANYLGWAEDLNGVDIPYLRDGDDSEWASGDVYVEKLHQGVSNSDSVSRLRYRLEHHPDMQSSGHKPGQGNSYGSECVEAVRYWQRNVMPKDTSGPTDGTSLSNPQANRLFGDAYHVHEK